MIPELFRIGPLSVSPFGVMLVAALFAGHLQLRWGLRRVGRSAAQAADDAAAILLAAALGGIAGGKAYYALLYGDWRLLYSRAGLVWYGGFLVGTAAVLFVIHRRRMPAWPTADAAAPALALGYGIGRLGCLFVGDDYGTPTALPWGMTFPEGPIPTRAGALRREFDVDLPADLASDALVAVHPTQLYETLTALLIFWLGRRLLARSTSPGGAALPILGRLPWGVQSSGTGSSKSGGVALLIIGLLSVERFLVEFLRAKDDRFAGAFTVAQLIAAALLLACALSWLRRRRAS